MIAGIDAGTQSLKVIILSPDLKILGQHAIGYQPDFPRAGWAEQDPRLWERALRPAIGGALADAGIAPQDITALGVAGQLDGCIATDAAGQALHSCLIWMDRRAEAEIAGIDPAFIQARTGVILDASHLAAKIRWLKTHLPEARDAVTFHVPVSYLVARLTGASVIDHATASTSMIYRLKTRAYDPDLLALFGIDETELPVPREAFADAGTLTPAGADLTGLPQGVRVVTGTGDDFSSALGAGLVAPGCLLNILGTAEVTGALHGGPAIDPQRLVETHAYSPGQYFIENPGWLSGGALTWFRTLFNLESFDELTALAAAVPAGAAGVPFLPALTEETAPEWIASARGAFYGLSPSHGTGHLARALLEGTAFAMRDVRDRLVEMGLTIDALRIVGGGAKSPLWREIRSGVTGLPVELPKYTDTSPLGAALLACANPLEAARAANPIVLAEEPGGGGDYEEAYQRYRRLFCALRPLF
ncbi:xylulokinase [soil metagenome]